MAMQPGAAKAPMLLLMDSPQKPADRAGDSASGDRAHQPTLGQLLVDMTAQVQDERARRSDVEKRNHSLMLEIEQLQKDMLELKTSCVSERRLLRRGSEEMPAPATIVTAAMASADAMPSARDESADYWWKELQEAKKVKEKALIEAHQRAMQVMELNACISMQHDELKALRGSEREAREAVVHAEEHCKELLQQATILQQENRILKDDVLHLNTEIGKRGVHFKALMDKWTEAQAQSEHLERENHAMLEHMKEIRERGELFATELERARDERDCLQHQVNHLKGAVAAKTAESKAFQAYGSNARDQLQMQTAVIQRHQVLRRKVHTVARDSVVTLRSLRGTLTTIRAPIVAIQHDFRAFLKNLQAPVVSLVTRSRRFAEVAHAEHQPLRRALLSAELSRRHLHDQLWRSRRNALFVCQIRNAPHTSSSSSSSSAAPEDDQAMSADVDTSRALRANYATGELFLKESERETLSVKFDSVYSDRAREWSNFESVTPVVQSVLDGCNACVATFETLLPLQTSSREPVRCEPVPALVLRELFDAARMHGAHFHRMRITVSYLGVFNECVYDLLGLDAALATARNAQAPPTSGQIVVLEVQNLDEALLVLRGGLENLASVHERGVMDTALTHKVVTICLTYENLLSGVTMTKSKLQIVELAAGSQYTAVQDHEWDDRSKLKALVTMENGVNALVTALAEVRVKDPAFVRYHGSKLTVLLQDTIKASAKFLSIVALPALIPAGDEGRVATVIRSIQQLRSAVSISTASPWGKAPSRDRSLEGFMSRFAQQQQQTQGESSQLSALSLLFSSSDIQERSCQALDEASEGSGGGGVDTMRWEKELDNMNKRYGADADLFATTFFQASTIPAVIPSAPVDTRESFATQVTQPAAAAAARGGIGSSSPGAIDFDGGSDDDALCCDPHQLDPEVGARVHPREFDRLTDPPPAPMTRTGSMSHRGKSVSSRGPGSSASSTASSKIGRTSSVRSTAGGHSRTQPDKKLKSKQSQQQQQQQRAATATTTPHARTTYSARVAVKPTNTLATTLTPIASAPSVTATGPMLKIRRETASSTLKKSRLAALVAASPSFARQQRNRTPFK